MKKEEIVIDGLYRIKKDDLSRCAEVAAKAFLDDESCKFLFSSGLTYKSLYEYYLVIYRAAYEKMYMFAESKNIDGFIIAAPLKNAALSFHDCIRTGAVKLILSQGFGILFRSLAYEKNCIRMRRNIVNSNSWYIFQFGVIPEKQGRKLGSKTIKPFLKWLDVNNKSCYLETQKLMNVKIYEHFGFSLKKEGTLPDKKKCQFSMFRE